MKPLFLPGPKQMALDIKLLESSVQEKRLLPTIRFYKWLGPWLSVGYHQKEFPKRWLDLLEQGLIQIVRRPSGGGAVLHSGGLTYCFIWPSPPNNRRESYLKGCEWLIKGFADIGLKLTFGRNRALAGNENCFNTSTNADLIDGDGQKRIGSAQLWRHGQLLQHGEILLDPPKDLWEKTFNEPAPCPAPNWIPREGLEKHLIGSFLENLNGQEWDVNQLSNEDWTKLKTKAKSFELDISKFQT